MKLCVIIQLYIIIYTYFIIFPFTIILHTFHSSALLYNATTRHTVLGGIRWSHEMR